MLKKLLDPAHVKYFLKYFKYKVYNIQNTELRKVHTRYLASTAFIMEKALGETQTLRAGRSNAEPKKIHPTADPFPVSQDGQNSISWRWSLPSPTDSVW